MYSMHLRFSLDSIGFLYQKGSTNQLEPRSNAKNGHRKQIQNIKGQRGNNSLGELTLE